MLHKSTTTWHTETCENDLDVGHVLIGHMGLSYIMRMG